MNKIIYILIILIIFSSCTKTIDVPLAEQSLVAYSKNIDLFSLDVIDNQFYFLSEEDTTQLNYYSLTPSGVFETVCNVNDYFPETYTVDSTSNYKAQVFEDKSKAVSFSYRLKGRKFFSLVKLDNNNQLQWQVTDTIIKEKDGYSLENISINTNGDINVFFTSGRPTPDLRTTVYLSSYNGTTGELNLQTQIVINGLIIQTIPLSEGGIMIFSGLPKGSLGTGEMVYENLRIWLYKDGELKNVETEYSVISYYMGLSQDGNNFIVSALTLTGEESYDALFFSVSMENGVNWDIYLPEAEIYGITNSSDGYIVTGKEFNTLSEGSILMAKINKQGDLMWNEPFKSETFGMGVIETEQTITWLGLSHESVIEESFFLVKTNNYGIFE